MNLDFSAYIILLGAFSMASCSDSQFSADSAKQKRSQSSAEVAGDENAIIDGLGDIGETETGSSDTAGSGEGDATAASGSGSDVSGSTAKSDGLSSVNDCVTAEARGYLVEATHTIDYPNNFKFPNQCTWPGGKKDSRVSGFREVRHTFNPPGGRVVCKMSLESRGSLRYDDSILLTLNDRALIWGSLGTGSIPRQPDGSWFYNWAHVVNNDTSPPNRLGCLPGATQCALPPTDSVGDFRLAFSNDVNLRLMREIEAGRGDFTLRTFGDNDQGDCGQSGLRLTIRYRYFAK